MDTIRDKEILEKEIKKIQNIEKKIIVIGGTGFIGFNLIKKIRKILK